MFQIVAAYVCLVLFFSLEFLLRKDKTAKSIRKTEVDNRSTIYIGLCFFVVLVVSVIFNLLKIGRFYNPRIANIGLAVMCLGLSFRVWAMMVLRKYYTRTLVTTDRQEIIRSGPYKIIRHPGYLGTCLVWSAAGVAMQNTAIFLCATVLILLAYYYRIRNEENMLLRQFGEAYQDYMRHSWSIIPLIW